MVCNSCSSVLLYSNYCYYIRNDLHGGRMNKLAIAYEAWHNKYFDTLDIDSILRQLEISHREFRKYVKSRHLLMPAPSQDLITEVITSGVEPSHAARLFNLSQADIQIVYYRGLADNSDCIDKGQMTQLLKDGNSNRDIAKLLGCSDARVSQLRKELAPETCTNNRKQKIVLKANQRKELKDYATVYGVAQAAKKFGVSLTTAYRIVGGY